MLKNYLKIALRNIWRQKGYSFINIAGLAVGITCCIFIMLYVRHELSYDAYHADVERIFRITLRKQTESRETHYAGCSPLVTETLREHYPQVESAARVATTRPYAITYKDRIFFEAKRAYVDPEIFEVLSIPFLKGNPGSALGRPFTVVLSEEMVEKYFGEEDPIGKTISLGSYSGSDDYEVTGVVKNPLSNTHWHYGFLMSWESQRREEGHPMGWDGPIFPAFVKLAEGTDPVAFEEQIARMAHDYIGEELEQQKTTLTLITQPIRDIHLHSHLVWEEEPPGNPVYIYIFSSVGVLILLIACMNFMNLATARSAARTCEVGIRKVIGAKRRQLVLQFLGESVIITLVALAIALVLVDLMMPLFNQVAGMKFRFAQLMTIDSLLISIIVVLLMGIAAGSYPAFFLSSFKPAAVLKGTVRVGSRGTMMRKILVVGQFTISIVLIMGTLTLRQQLNYMKDRHLGFDKDQKLILSFDHEAVNPGSFEAVKGEFLQHASVNGATFSSSVPGRWMYLWRVWLAGEEVENNHVMNFFQVDYDFIPEYGIKLSRGRAFDREYGSEPGNYIINEAAARKFGWDTPEEALGKHLDNERRTIIGVTEDFHFRGLQSPVEPLIMFLMDEDYKYLSLTVDTVNLDETLAFLRGKYRNLFPGKPFEYFFLDEDFNLQYQFEDQAARIFSIFTSLGILIACLGLFGVAAYIAEQRTKEIGIRKVLGATVSSIVGLMTKEFVMLVLISCLIAGPVAYYAMNKYLQSYAYRIDLSILVVVLAGALALMIALLTVSYQAIKAATLDPVKSLRYE